MKINANSSYEEVLNALMIDGNQLQFANNEFKPNAALLLPVVLLYKACKPTALLPYPIVLEFKAA